MRIKRTFFLLPVFVLLFFLVSYLFASINFDKKVNQLIMSSIGDAEKLNPILATDSASSDITDLVFNGLVKYNEDQELVGSLAKDWKIRQVTRFYLKEGSSISTGEVISEIKNIFGIEGISGFKILDIQAGPNKSVIIKLDAAGRAFEKEIESVVRDKLRPIKVLYYRVEREHYFNDDVKVNAVEVLKRIEQKIYSNPDLKARFLKHSIESSMLLRVLLLGSEDDFLLLFDEHLKDKDGRQVGKMSGIESMFFDNNPVITFYLRDDVRWHDGESFDAYDVLFTYEKIMDEKTNTVRRPMFELVKSLEVINPHEVKVTYKKPFSPSLENWSMGILPRHILNGQDINTSSFNRNPVGTGPFKFSEWISDERITLVANDDYFEGRPELDMISYRIIPEPPLKELEFFIKGVDLDTPQPHQFRRYSTDKRFNVYRRLSNGYTYIGWNHTVPLFQDIRVRRALTYAINRGEIVKYLLYDLGVIATGPFPQQMWYSNPGTRPLEFNPEKAVKLLNEAGWKDSDRDGILDKDGKPFSFTLITNNGNILRQNVAVLVQRQLRNIGIKVDIELYEWSVFIRDKINPRNFEACVLGWSLSLDPDIYEIWHSSQAEKGFNFISYSNPEVDRLIEEGRTEYDKEKRRRIYFKIHELINKDQPYAFLYVAEETPALHHGDFKIRKKRSDGRVDIEPIKMTKIGLLYYLKDWFRVSGPVLEQ